MTASEFEERAYEAPLYDQLQGADRRVFSPGQVLENELGFDRGLFVAQKGLWRILGHKAPPRGAALANSYWPGKGGPKRSKLPRFRLNLFLQAKRPFYHQRKPRALREVDVASGPMWAFPIKDHQQRLLEVLAEKTKKLSHISYAAPAFHTYSALFSHTENGTVVLNSTFPSVGVLRGHEWWYYKGPGAEGVANPTPEVIRELPLIARIAEESRQGTTPNSDNLEWLESLAHQAVETARFSEGRYSAMSSQFFTDIQALDLYARRTELQQTLVAFVQVQLFTIRFGLDWLIFEDEM